MTQNINQSFQKDPLGEAIPLDDVADDLGVVRKRSLNRDGEFGGDFYDENEFAEEEIELGLRVAQVETDGLVGPSLLSDSFDGEEDDVQLSGEVQPFQKRPKEEKALDGEFGDDEFLEVDNEDIK